MAPENAVVLDADVVPALEGVLAPGDEPIETFEGVPVPPEAPEPWWVKRRRLALGLTAILSVLLIVGAAVGATVGVRNPKEDGLAVPNNTSEEVDNLPTLSPTLPPLPFECSIEDLGQFYVDDESTRIDKVTGGDDGSVVIHDENGEVRFLSLEGEIITVSGPHRLGYVQEIAFSDDALYSSITLQENIRYGFVNATARDADGAVSGETTILTPDNDTISKNSEFGAALAVDGDVLVVGGRYDGGDDAGSAFVYCRSGPGSWEEEAKLTPSGTDAKAFGYSLAVEGDLVIVGARGFRDTGRVFFHRRDLSSGAWERIPNSTLAEEDCDGQFGYGLALDADGGLLVACPQENRFRGAVYYYRRSDDGRLVFSQKITSGDGDTRQLGGNNNIIAANPAGNTVAIGTRRKADSVERIYLYRLHDGAWREVAKINAPRGTRYFGENVAFLGEDRVLVVSWEDAFMYRLNCVDVETRNGTVSDA